MGQDIEFRRQKIKQYKKDVEPLFAYLSWFEEKKGARVSSVYGDEELQQHSMTFPVYDGTLLSFVKEVQRGELTDRNYVYVYSRYKISGPKDERRLIESVTIKNIEILTGILSKYICGGMTKSWLWSQAVEEGIFYAILLKFKALFDMWDQPLANQGEWE